jgi:hypothetical protein
MRMELAVPVCTCLHCVVCRAYVPCPSHHSSMKQVVRTRKARNEVLHVLRFIRAWKTGNSKEKINNL